MGACTGRNTTNMQMSVVILSFRLCAGRDPFTAGGAKPKQQQLYVIFHSVSGEIAELAAKGHYQIACQKYWEATHRSSLEAGINHPNQYLEESRKVAALGPNAKPAAPGEVKRCGSYVLLLNDSTLAA